MRESGVAFPTMHESVLTTAVCICVCIVDTRHCFARCQSKFPDKEGGKNLSEIESKEDS